MAVKMKSNVYESHNPGALERLVQLTIKWSLKGITRFSTKRLEIKKSNILLQKIANVRSKS